MVEIPSPHESYNRYTHDPAYLEGRFGVRPLQELRLIPGVIGVARLVVMPSFSGESVNTFVYRADEVTIEVRRAEHSLWDSLEGGDWLSPEARTYTIVADYLPAPLNRWQSLKEAAQSAPTVEEAIIGGLVYCTLDGVVYRHHVADADADLHAKWSNPKELAANHVSQVRLVRAYGQVLQFDSWKDT